MDDETQPPLIASSPSDAAERSLVEDVRRLVEDGRTLLEAELAFQKSRAAVAGSSAKGIAAWGALALALVFFALMALVMGSLLALTPALGGWGAMGVVVAVLLLVAAFSGWTASRRFKKMSALLADKDPAA